MEEQSRVWATGLWKVVAQNHPWLEGTKDQGTEKVEGGALRHRHAFLTEVKGLSRRKSS